MTWHAIAIIESVFCFISAGACVIMATALHGAAKLRHFDLEHIRNLMGHPVRCADCGQEIPPVTGTHVCRDGKLTGFLGTTFGRSKSGTEGHHE